MSEDSRTIYDRAVAAWAAGRMAEAEADLRALNAAHPDEPHVAHALSHVLLSQGGYAEGWPLYEARHRILATGSPKPDLPFPEWRGEPLAGKRLLVWPEQGAGDQIMHSRFAAWAARQGAEVTLAAPPPLFRLFQSLEGVRVIEAAGQAQVEADLWVMLSSMAGRAGFTLDTLPAAPYLRAPGVDRRGRIGVVTSGNPRHPTNPQRSLPPALAERLLALPGAVSLAPEHTGAKDFADTAAIVEGCEVVISVCTSAAHLAGALGKPVRILLFAPAPDWRWGTTGDRAPWYPTARLDRQAAPGDWTAAVEAAVHDLG